MAGLPSFPWSTRREPVAWCRTALAQHASLQAAVDAVSQQLGGSGAADLALVFVSASFASDLPRLLPLLQQKLQASHWLGCLGGGVVGTDVRGVPHELEQEPALSVTLLRLPGASLQPFAIDTAELPDLDGPAEPWRRILGPRHGERPSAPPRDLPPARHAVDKWRRAIHDSRIDDLDDPVTTAGKVVIRRIQYGPLRGPAGDSPS